MSDFQIYFSRFFWDFRRKDNVIYNFEIVKALILASISYKPDKHREHFYKPIFIIMMSIIECILYDFLIRIPGATQEGVPNLNQTDIDLIKDTNIPNKLVSLIEICKKYELLAKRNDPIYESIRTFANIRNRIHIQNVKGEKPPHEVDLWTTSLVKGCGNLLKDICLIMCDKYPRPEHIHLELAVPRPISFPEPWDLLNS